MKNTGKQIFFIFEEFMIQFGINSENLHIYIVT